MHSLSKIRLAKALLKKLKSFRGKWVIQAMTLRLRTLLLKQKPRPKVEQDLHASRRLADVFLILKAMIRKRCPYFYELKPVMGDCPSAAPLAYMERGGVILVEVAWAIIPIWMRIEVAVIRTLTCMLHHLTTRAPLQILV